MGTTLKSSNGIASVVRVGCGLVIWLGVALSLGWYYTFTYYGRTGIPMPTLEPCAALVLYYFSVLNVRTEIQAVHWLVVFPMAGLLWAQALRVTARFLRINTPSFPMVFFALALAAIPIVLPAPWMTWVAGYEYHGSAVSAVGQRYEAGFSMARMLHVALRRYEQSPWTALTPMYLGLGVLALVLQLTTYRRLFALPLGLSLKHYLLSAVLLSAAAAVLGAAAGIPMRLLLE